MAACLVYCVSRILFRMNLATASPTLYVAKRTSIAKCDGDRPEFQTDHLLKMSHNLSLHHVRVIFKQ